MKVRAAAIVVMVLCLSTGLASAASGRIFPASRPLLVYSTNWKHGTLGWRRDNVSPWRVKGGVLRCHCSSALADNSFVAPYPTNQLTDYAVKARMRFGGWTGVPVYQDFGVFVRTSQTPWNDESGVYAGYDNYDTGKGAAIWLHTSPHNVQDPYTTADFHPGAGWHTLELQVVGNQMSLSVDGQRVVSAVTKRWAARHGVGVFAASANVWVQWFRIYKL